MSGSFGVLQLYNFAFYPLGTYHSSSMNRNTCSFRYPKCLTYVTVEDIKREILVLDTNMVSLIQQSLHLLLTNEIYLIDLTKYNIPVDMLCAFQDCRFTETVSSQIAELTIYLQKINLRSQIQHALGKLKKSGKLKVDCHDVGYNNSNFCLR